MVFAQVLRIILLVLAVLADLTVAALLISFSGFLFEPGPEILHGELWFETVYLAAVIACVIAPATGFILNAAGKHGPAQVVAWLPATVVLIALVIPVFSVAGI